MGALYTYPIKTITIPNRVVRKAIVAIKKLLTALAVAALGASLAPAAVAAPKPIPAENANIFTLTDSTGSLSLTASVAGQNQEPGQAYDPQAILLSVTGKSAKENIRIPEGIGESSYFLSQPEDGGPFGWDSSALANKGYGAARVRFKKIEGPGKVFAYHWQEGQSIGALSGGETLLSSGSTMEHAEPERKAISWLFEKAGTYKMTVAAEAEKEGQTVRSAERTYTWQIGQKHPNTSTRTYSAPEKETVAAAPKADSPRTNKGEAKRVEQTQNQPTSGENAAGEAPTPTAARQETGECKLIDSDEEGLQAVLKDDRTAPSKWIDPASITFPVGEAAKQNLSSALGPVQAGHVWLIGATQTKNVPWLGANTMHETLVEKTDGPVKWKLTGFRGPGTMFVFTNGNLGEAVGQKWFLGKDNSASGEVDIPHNTHVHPNWAFTKPGNYEAEITQTAKGKDGKSLSAKTTLHFTVGKGAMDGHFDLGAKIGKGGKVWRTPDGKECKPAAGLAGTGTSSFTGSLSVLATGLAVFGIGVLVRRKCAN